jgi:hypothetical protein
MDNSQQPQKNARGADSNHEQTYISASPRAGFVLHVSLGPFAAPESMQSGSKMQPGVSFEELLIACRTLCESRKRTEV